MEKIILEKDWLSLTDLQNCTQFKNEKVYLIANFLDEHGYRIGSRKKKTVNPNYLGTLGKIVSTDEKGNPIQKKLYWSQEILKQLAKANNIEEFELVSNWINNKIFPGCMNQIFSKEKRENYVNILTCYVKKYPELLSMLRKAPKGPIFDPTATIPIPPISTYMNKVEMVLVQVEKKLVETEHNLQMIKSKKKQPLL